MQKTVDTNEPIVDLDPLSYENIYSDAKDYLENLACKFSRAIDRSIFKELDRIFALLEPIFINQRSSQHLAKLAYSIYFIRRKLSQNMTHFPFRDHFDVRVFSSILHFAFSKKQALSILTHAYLKDKYEVFEEEQILFLIRKIVPDSQLIRGSVYTFHPAKRVKSLYFEIDKKNGGCFSKEEIKQIRKQLTQEVRFSVERLVPRVFMIRNEEETLKNILTLNREIKVVADLPQLMILLDQQTTQEVLFTVIVVRVLKKSCFSMAEAFKKKLLEAKYLPDRCQIVRYLRKKYPVEANVFRIKLPKDPSLLRVDRSLNFYLARNRISQILLETIGKFRDYNGGIILTQREILSSFRELFPEICLNDPDLIENFYYSISPIETQATLSLDILEEFFKLFLEARSTHFANPSDFFFKTYTRIGAHFIVIRIPDETFRGKVDLIFTEFKLNQKTITFSHTDKNTYFLGYLLMDVGAEIQKLLSQTILQALQQWKSKVETRQIFRISIEHPVVSLDPRIGGDQTSSVVLKMLFEGLMRKNAKGELEKGLAQEIEISPDQKTYFFTLRKTCWSDGSFVTAEDFAYAWKKVLSPNFKTPFAYFFYPIKNAKLAKEGLIADETIGIKALDSMTLKIELEFPSPYFLEMISNTIYSPINRRIDQKHPNWPFEDGENYVCNGAFQLRKNHSNQNSYKLVKNPLYWDKDTIKLEEVVILQSNRHHCYEMFQKGFSDWTGSPFSILEPTSTLGKNDVSVNFLNAVVYWLVFNTKLFPFNNKKIRKAFAWAIYIHNLQEVCNELPAISPISPLHSQINASEIAIPSLREIQDMFREGLQEIHLPLGDFPPIPITYLVGSKKTTIILSIKEHLEKVFSIKCILEPVDWKNLFSRLTKGEFTLGGISWESWIDDPIYTFNAFRNADESINFSKWENKDYQDIMFLTERETDIDKRKEYYLQAENILIEERPVIPLYLTKALAFKKKNFHIHHVCAMTDFKWGYFTY